MGVGQFCTNPGLAVIDASSSSQEFLAELSRLMSATQAAAMLNGTICQAYHKGIAALSAKPGVRRLAAAAE